MTKDLERIWSERALMEHLNCTPEDLEDLRSRGMPFIRLRYRLRAYDIDSVAEWLEKLDDSRPRRPRMRREELEGVK